MQRLPKTKITEEKLSKSPNSTENKKSAYCYLHDYVTAITLNPRLTIDTAAPSINRVSSKLLWLGAADVPPSLSFELYDAST